MAPGIPRPIEEAILLACARNPEGAERTAGPDSSPGEEPERRSPALPRREVDWDRLCREARRHGVLPLLHKHLASAGAGAVPAAVRARLAAHFEANRRRNLFLAGELWRLLEVLGARGIEAVPYKGAALAASAYGDLSLRQFTDTDLFVRRREVTAAAAALGTLGYRPASGEAGGTAALLRRENELLLLRADGRVFVELHWEISPRYFAVAQDPQGLLERADRGPADGSRLPAFAPEDTLLILAVHGARHLWERLIWIADLARHLAREPSLDFGRAAREARRLGAARILALALRLARNLLGADLPEAALAFALGDRAAAALAREIEGRLFAPPDPAAEPIDRLRLHLRMRERWRDRLRLAVRLGLRVSPGDRALLPLPRALSPLQRLVRPARLLAKYGGRVLRSRA